jgi:hypothetical protein
LQEPPDRTLESALLTLATETAAATPWRHPNPGSTERTYELLELTDIYEVWAIHWPTMGHVELHDHGGSAGALYVVNGELEESRLLRPASLIRRSITAGHGVEVAPFSLHDVSNIGPSPATSVHVYSPPLSHMNFYSHDDKGTIRRQRTEFRVEPTWNL